MGELRELRKAALSKFLSKLWLIEVLAICLSIYIWMGVIRGVYETHGFSPRLLIPLFMIISLLFWVRRVVKS